jgi:glycosidase
VFGFGLKDAIVSFDKQKLIAAADTILAKCPKGKEQIVFIENHDLDRYASIEPSVEKQKTAAAMLFLIGGLPSMYYGQEIGMQGKSWSFGNTDGNDIPRREAFEWYSKPEGKGMALWYKNTGQWWSKTNLKANDGISLEEQKNNSQSLFNHYKTLINLKQSNPALAKGNYELAENNNSQVFSFYRTYNEQKLLVVVNLSNEGQTANFAQDQKMGNKLYGESTFTENVIQLKPYEVVVIEIK